MTGPGTDADVRMFGFGRLAAVAISVATVMVSLMVYRAYFPEKTSKFYASAAAVAGGSGKGDAQPLSARLGAEGYGTFWEAAVDSRGDIIVTGYGTEYVPDNFPGARVIGTPEDENILLAKYTPGGRLLWMSIIGGTGKDEALGLALDPSDNIYIAGVTSSLDLPTTPGAFDRTNNGGGTHCSGPHGCNLDAYVMKLAPDGASLVYSTYLGGSGEDIARGGVAVDREGNAYVTGSTASTDFLEKGRTSSRPHKVNAFHGGTHDAFVAKISPDGSGVVYSMYLGGSKDDNEEVGVAVTVDEEGRAYVQAVVRSDDAATTPDAYGPSFRGGVSDTYLTRLFPDGAGQAYATFIGGSGSEFAEHGMKVDRDGNVYITGYTDSADFDRVNAHQSVYGGGGDGYLARIGPDGRPVFSTFVGGRGEDVTFGPAVDREGNVYVTGRTASPDFEVTPGALDMDFNGGVDSFLRVYGPDGRLLYSTFLGGSGDDNTRGITLDREGNPIILGSTTSKDFPASSGAPAHGGSDYGDGFMVIVDLKGAGLLQSLGGVSPPLRTKE